MSRDTDPAVMQEYRRRLLALPPEKRIRMACGMFQSAKELVLADLRRSGLRRGELRAALFRRFYGSEFSAEDREALAERLARTPERASR